VSNVEFFVAVALRPLPRARGLGSALEWLAKTFPDVFRPPRCPEPLQQQAGLKYPAIN
jgi:hypothetical protein